MADNVLSTWSTFLPELQGKVYELFPSEAPFLAELSGYDNAQGMVDRASSVKRITQGDQGGMGDGRDRFSGRYVRHQIITSGLTGGGQVQENSTWNVPHTLQSQEVHINLVHTLVPFSVSVDVERDSMDSGAAAAVATLVGQTRSACARLENLQMLGDGTGLIAAITDAATSLTTTVATTSNFDVLLPGSVWDILTVTTGADPGQGLRRRIASVNETTGVITWDTANVASDGGTGNIVHAATSGIYIPGSWSNGTAGTSTAPGALCGQGLGQAAAVTGTFESLNKATILTWQGTDGRGGDTTTIALSASMLDGAVRRGRRAGLGKWDFAIGDPQCIDLFKQGLYASVRYDPQTVTLKSGFSGIAYDGADAPITLIKEPMHPKGAVRLIDKASFQLYGDAPGPSFLDDDGGMFRRFTRTLAKEADMLDRWQMGVTRCNTLVSLSNLAQAA